MKGGVLPPARSAPCGKPLNFAFARFNPRPHRAQALMQLYTYFRSSATYRVRIAMNLKIGRAHV